MWKKLPIIFAGLIALLMIASPIAYKRMRDRETRNLRVVEEGVLYRSGQLSVPRLRELVLTHGIRTVISLRDGDDAMDKDEESWVKASSRNFVRLPYKQWTPDAAGQIPAEANLKVFRDVMDDPANYPVLVHCFAGIHRTGMMCAVYRMDYQGWTSQQAMAEMRVLGYTILDDHKDVLDYLIKYRSPDEPRKVPVHPAAFKK